MRQILDKHAPEATKIVSLKPESPWYTEEVHMAKITKRMAERRWRKSRLTIDREVYIREKNKMKRVIKHAKSKYFQEQICEKSRNPKALSNLLSRLLNSPNAPPTIPTAPTKSQADTFGDFFKDKIMRIRKTIAPTLSSVNTQDKSENHHPELSEFTLFQPEEIREIIKTMRPTTCKLDSIPTQLFITCLDVLLPIITDVVNHSLKKGQFPSALKKAIIRPLLKKAGANTSVLANYRPVSNLTFLSKIIERAVSKRLCHYLNTHGLLSNFQSAYRPEHSTETALLRVLNDLYCAVDNGQVALVVMLDLSAAFDTIDHDMMLGRLKDLGLSSTVLSWFKSYLSGRTYKVLVKDSISNDYDLPCGVPQGSILGPILYSVYTTPLSRLIESHLIPYHLYADDTMLYLTSSPENFHLAKIDIEKCSLDIKNWMGDNFLKLNEDKTEAILIGADKNTKKISDKYITVAGTNIQLSDSVRYLGLKIDRQLSLDKHVSHIISAAHLNLRRITSIRHCLTKSSTTTLVVTLVLSLLDYCNSALAGASQKQLHRLQRLQNIGARVVERPPRRAHMTPILRSLHWLPVHKRILHKLLCVVFRCVTDSAPIYLKELLEDYKPVRDLRSSSKMILNVPKTMTKAYGNRSFSFAGPKCWNIIPEKLRKSLSLKDFKKGLKTYLFNVET